MRRLVIVESPGKVKTISKILGKDYIVRPTVGHIMDLAKGKGRGDIGVDIQKGFIPRYEILKDKSDKIKAILDAARISDEILVASDNDREGECISFHIKSQLEKFGKPIKRIVFNEITKRAILNAVKSPREFDNHLYDAQQARRVLDRIVGFMVSPYLSKKMGDNLSAGRVQSVALRLIVDKEKEIESFIPEVFYNISVTLSKDDDKFIAKIPERIKTIEEADKIKKDIEKSEKFIISKIQNKKHSRKAPPPLITSTLQQEASTKFKFKAERTMLAAQQLYEAGLVTYIRTDSVRNSDESIDEVRKFLKKIKYEIPDKPNEFKNKDASQNAHEAIRPTNITMTPEKVILDGDKLKIYDLIWRMFLASQMKPVLSEIVKVYIKPSKGSKELLAEGKILREEGWLSIVKTFTKKEKDIILPKLNKSDELSLIKPVIKDKSKTKAPQRYTEASLIAELERKEIGRPSTYAAIISRISVRKYVINTSKGFLPTDLGRKVVDDLSDRFSFMDYMYTAGMEKKLDQVAEGKLDYLSMMQGFFDGFKVEFQKARGSQGMLTGIKCPKCGEEMVVRKSIYGFFAGCLKYKAGCDGIVAIEIEDGVVLKKGEKRKVDENVRCPECDSPMVPRPDGQFGPFYSCSKYPKCYGKRKMPFGKKCPKCGNELYATLFKGIMKLACMGYPNCKHIEEIPKGSKINWIDPEKVIPPIYSKKVEKVIKDI